MNTACPPRTPILHPTHSVIIFFLWRRLSDHIDKKARTQLISEEFKSVCVCGSDSGRPPRPGLLLRHGGLSGGAVHRDHGPETPEQEGHGPRPDRTVQHLRGQEAYTTATSPHWNRSSNVAIKEQHTHNFITVFIFVDSFSQTSLRNEDGDDEAQLPPSGRKDRRRSSVGGTNERRGLERRRSRRHSLQNSRGHASAPASPSSTHTHAGSFLPFGGQGVEDISERWGGRSLERKGKMEDVQEKKKKLCPCFHFSLNLIWSSLLKLQTGGFVLYFRPGEITARKQESQMTSGSMKYYSFTGNILTGSVVLGFSHTDPEPMQII